MDYLRGGVEISLICSIDFTQSNGDPKDPKSLHYFQPDSLNEYQKAITAVGEVLSFYDPSHRYPVSDSWNY